MYETSIECGYTSGCEMNLKDGFMRHVHVCHNPSYISYILLLVTSSSHFVVYLMAPSRARNANPACSTRRSTQMPHSYTSKCKQNPMVVSHGRLPSSSLPTKRRSELPLSQKCNETTGNEASLSKTGRDRVYTSLSFSASSTSKLITYKATVCLCISTTLKIPHYWAERDP